MTDISEEFVGYLTVRELTFAYSVSKHIVKLLPTCDNNESIMSSISQMYSYDLEFPQYLIGIDEHEHAIAFLLNQLDRDSNQRRIIFASPIIIKATGNTRYFHDTLLSKWQSFDAISFHGGNINAIYPPKIALQKPTVEEIDERVTRADGANSIHIKPYEEYTHSVNVMFDNEPADLVISVMQDGKLADEFSNSLGMVQAFIRLSFKNSQSFIQVEPVYYVIKKLVSILTLQPNLGSSIVLFQRNGDNLLNKTAICKLIDNHQDYSTENPFSVIPLNIIIKIIPKLIKMIQEGSVKALLLVLEGSNTALKSIFIKDVQNLCSALEVEYKYSDGKKSKDEIISKLKQEIKDTIGKFTEENPDVDVNKQTTISRSFQYLDYTLKDKILYLYNENQEFVNQVSNKYNSAVIDIESIGKFVNIRNNSLHSGTFNFGEGIELFVPLLALAYACVFKRAGLSDQEITAALSRAF